MIGMHVHMCSITGRGCTSVYPIIVICMSNKTVVFQNLLVGGVFDRTYLHIYSLPVLTCWLQVSLLSIEDKLDKITSMACNKCTHFC